MTLIRESKHLEKEVPSSLVLMEVSGLKKYLCGGGWGVYCAFSGVLNYKRLQSNTKYPHAISWLAEVKQS